MRRASSARRWYSAMASFDSSAMMTPLSTSRLLLSFVCRSEGGHGSLRLKSRPSLREMSPHGEPPGGLPMHGGRAGMVPSRHPLDVFEKTLEAPAVHHGVAPV